MRACPATLDPMLDGDYDTETAHKITIGRTHRSSAGRAARACSRTPSALFELTTTRCAARASTRSPTSIAATQPSACSKAYSFPRDERFDGGAGRRWCDASAAGAAAAARR